MELGAVIGGDAVHRVWFAEELPDRTLRGFFRGGARQFSDPDETTLTVHQRQDAGFTLPMHGVSLPVTAPQSLRYDVRPLADHGFAGQAPPTVFPTVAFAPLLACPSEVPPQGSVASLIGPDVKIDRLVT